MAHGLHGRFHGAGPAGSQGRLPDQKAGGRIGQETQQVGEGVPGEGGHGEGAHEGGL